MDLLAALGTFQSVPPGAQKTQGHMATSSATIHRPITEYMVPVRHTARQEEIVAADDDGQKAEPSGIVRPQSAMPGASVVAAASDEEDEGEVSISSQF